MQSPRVYHFAPFRLSPDQRLLTAHDQPLKLGGRALDMLLVLVERRDRTVSKDDLLSLVWPNLVVEENNLQVQIGTLRKLLGHQAIATVPGRGYRFTMPLEVEGPEDGNTARAVDVPMRGAASNKPRLTNLPDQLPLTYGSDADVANVCRMLAAHPLVTIAGAGGIGKTRLAQTAALAARQDFADGVWWVDLAPLTSQSLVAPTVARAMGIQVANEHDATQALLSVIRSQQVLLVIDNCEHLLEGVATLMETIVEKSTARLLVTSQEVLRTAAEHVYRLGTLDVPQVASLAAVQASGAGALFTARAHAADPRFVLGQANVDAVAEICRQLDGIPLAIELAAARTPLLGAEGVRLKLGQRLNLLTAGARVVLRRHQTLRAALEWSHGLLTNDERAVFRRLGIFAGGFTLESAQRVADDDDIDTWDVLEHLGALADKSLVLAEGDAVPRYRLLETTRLFALERMAEAGETNVMTRRHAEAMLSMLQAYHTDDKRYQTSAPDWALMAAELDNMRAALGHVRGSATLDAMGLELVTVSLMCFHFAGALAEGFAHLRFFRDSVRSELPQALQGKYWLALAQAGSVAGSVESMDAAYKAAELFEHLGDAQRRYAALVWVVATSARLRDVKDVSTLIDEAARLEKPDWPPRLRSHFQWAQQRWLLRQGRPEDALVCARKQVALVAGSGALATARMIEAANVVYCEFAAGRVNDAERHSRDLLDLGQPPGDDAGHALDTLMLILIAQRRFAEAIDMGRAALTRLQRVGDQFRLLESLALMAAETGRLEDAAQVAGYVDQVMAGTREVRWPLAAENRSRLDQLLASLSESGRERLFAQGALLSAERAFGHALGGAAAEEQKPADASHYEGGESHEH
jgi:predicted ATPase/DNA-binding winged helix-turn-helix (wHTH) protein